MYIINKINEIMFPDENKNQMENDDPAVGGSLVLCVSIYTGLKWWKKRKHERNRTTYICNVKVCDDLKLHADDEKVEADRDAEGEQLERITNELEKIRLELDKIPDVEDI